MAEARKGRHPDHLWEREVFGGISKGNCNRKGRVGLTRKPLQGHSFAHSSSPLESNVWTQFEYECVDPFLQPSDPSYFPCSVSSQLPASLGPWPVPWAQDLLIQLQQPLQTPCLALSPSLRVCRPCVIDCSNW